MNTQEKAIAQRYDSLAQEECCLSCGMALSYAEVQPGEICVDLGSGRGHDVFRMAILTGEKGFVYGLDISTNMIQAARETATKLALNNIAFIHSTLENIELNGGIADLVISNCTINHSLCQDLVWREIARILRPGGRFVVSDIYAVEEVPEEFASDPVMVSECWAGAVTRNKYIDNIKNAGFTQIRIIEESRPYAKGKIMTSSFTVSGINYNK